MAIGWSKDGMVQEQIENSIDDAIALVRNKLHSNSQSLSFCEECDAPIPEARRRAIKGVRLCIECQKIQDKRNKY
ncbi:DksA/TraR family C4-type zinc finger protein [Escherichia coli]|jgi:phage/conjugal plasmid C-4 type zinc finger TraR family protein|nr:MULTISPECIES: DksA/TraR family C4-type zinc finger protein [Gammaproteobacteria]EKU5386367.1 DksA/TraR family C4-type zinc finger protein [Escherichia coli]ELA9961559.1 DksA/TraR family C4-type zinc finger protein [Proteus mirabilis]HCR4036260.1 DksA/TraR family C4-type zinc finger protein [Morganella morganii]ARD70827.1 hypothetical protein pC131_00097 [Providencia rettgeri]EKX8269041.1 DksA/TraR family C4-type zinc finger protein [Escherichia coli]